MDDVGMMSGFMDSWKKRAEKAEAQNRELVEALEGLLDISKKEVPKRFHYEYKVAWEKAESLTKGETK